MQVPVCMAEIKVWHFSQRVCYVMQQTCSHVSFFGCQYCLVVPATICAASKIRLVYGIMIPKSQLFVSAASQQPHHAANAIAEVMGRHQVPQAGQQMQLPRIVVHLIQAPHPMRPPLSSQQHSQKGVCQRQIAYSSHHPYSACRSRVRDLFAAVKMAS